MGQQYLGGGCLVELERFTRGGGSFSFLLVSYFVQAYQLGMQIKTKDLIIFSPPIR